jgi:selenium metabolism protein YedF
MSGKTLDCRGLACPNPVIKTKELIDQGEVQQLTVLVDNPAAQENVGRFLQRAGFEVKTEGQGDSFAITGARKDTGTCQVLVETPEEAGRKILVLMGADRLGRGDDLLGAKLMGNFIATLKEMGPELWCVVLLNAGVKLARFWPVFTTWSNPGSGSWCAAPASIIFSSWRPSRRGKPPTCWISSPPCRWPTR